MEKLILSIRLIAPFKRSLPCVRIATAKSLALASRKIIKFIVQPNVRRLSGDWKNCCEADLTHSTLRLKMNGPLPQLNVTALSLIFSRFIRRGIFFDSARRNPVSVLK